MNEKNYVLAKDLPFAKKVSKISARGEYICVNTGEDNFSVMNCYGESFNKAIARFIAEGLIEEVKPKEPIQVWINQYLFNDGLCIFGTWHRTEDEAKGKILSNTKYIKTIHFREVLGE
jgi:hypothetical protein